MNTIGRRHFILDPEAWNERRDPACAGVCNVAAAAVGAAGSIGGSLIGGIFGSSAQTAAADQANWIQQVMMRKAQRALHPYIRSGKVAMKDLLAFLDPDKSKSPLNALMRLTMPGANMTKTLEQTPGYQFTRDMGLKSIDNSLAARGLAGPGGALARASADYVTGLSQNTWQNQVNALLSSFGAGSTALQNLVSTGAGAAGNLAGQATATGAQMGQNYIGAGNAQAGMWNSLGGAIGNAGNYFGNAMMTNKLLGLYGG